MNKNSVVLHIVWMVCLFTVFSPLGPADALDGTGFELIRKVEERASLQRMEAQKKQDAVNNYYTKGRACYNRGDFLGAIANFEGLLKLEPDYEPAKLYLKCAIIRDKLYMQEDKIYSLKIKMADVAADYDRKIEQTEGLAFAYLLEQALLRCQAGDFNGAEHYYNLCYKLDPENKERINWFVNATYELKDLSDSLDECYKAIEELPELELEELVSSD